MVWVRNNLNDTIGSDHAPHLKVNKDKEYPNSPSGMPGVQTLMPVMLDHVNHGKLSLTQLVNLVCENPIKIFGIKKGKREKIINETDLKEGKKLSESFLTNVYQGASYHRVQISSEIIKLSEKISRIF